MGIQYAQAMKGNVKKGMSPRPGQQTPQRKSPRGEVQQKCKSSNYSKTSGHLLHSTIWNFLQSIKKQNIWFTLDQALSWYYSNQHKSKEMQPNSHSQASVLGIICGHAQHKTIMLLNMFLPIIMLQNTKPDNVMGERLVLNKAFFGPRASL